MYQRGLEKWIAGLLQPVFDNLIAEAHVSVQGAASNSSSASSTPQHMWDAHWQASMLRDNGL